MINLSDFSVFQGVSEEDFKEFEPLFIVEDFKKKDLIFSEGDSPEWFYFVIDGEVKITKLSMEGKEIILELIAPGGFFGGIAVMRGFPYPANAIAKEDTRVAKASKSTIEGIMKRFPDVMFGLMQDMGDRMRDSRETTKNIALEKVHMRIASLLLKLANTKGKSTPDGIVLEQKLTKQDIAEMVGTTVETAIRTMSAFKKQKLVEEKAGKIIIKDPSGLEDASS